MRLDRAVARAITQACQEQRDRDAAWIGPAHNVVRGCEQLCKSRSFLNRKQA